jgi:putative FmdB family regulatory protein
MPMYDFECDACGYLFTKRYTKYMTHEDLPSTACSSCGSEARRGITTAAFKFSHASGQTRGMLPPNTGTSDDWNFDKAIGRDAEQKWRIIGERDAAKSDAIRNAHKDGIAPTRDQLVRKHDDGGYRVITESERVDINSRRDVARAVAKAASTASKEPPR